MIKKKPRNLINTKCNHDTTQNPGRVIMLIQSSSILMHGSNCGSSGRQLWGLHHQVPSQAHQHYHRQSTIFSTPSSCKPYIIPTMTSWCFGGGKDDHSYMSYLIGHPLHNLILQYGTCEYPQLLGKKKEVIWSLHLTSSDTCSTNNKSAPVLIMRRPYP